MLTITGLGRHGAAMTGLAAVGLAIGAYLLAARVIGEAPACGPIKGCDTVAASEYATVLGVPVALFGVAFSMVLVASAALWWRRGDRRSLYAAYGLGLLGIATVAYLTYLELFVIEAICIWCVSYGVTILVGWLLAAVALRSATD
jgi:uncharacterized membrane protein